ncbi:hypothetical protein BOTBODRAFT_176346 [Botryobasidium botryosum FD-172 SS1]|uniref:Uncharacterized protein n=1 Tax=Botryobasidium botryosum (strain FD-172 SS1) TaxID=930990 RepID=A0A067MKL8_BOTB1|nr:hypothetical protein BOTBODRAFT_176346 [Botryobasidium botryosum FD-172 SS1]
MIARKHNVNPTQCPWYFLPAQQNATQAFTTTLHDPSSSDEDLANTIHTILYSILAQNLDPEDFPDHKDHLTEPSDVPHPHPPLMLYTHSGLQSQQPTLDIALKLSYWVKAGHNHVFDWVQNITCIGSSIVSHSTLLPEVFWEPHSSTKFSYQGHSITTNNFITMVHSIMADVCTAFNTLWEGFNHTSIDLPENIVDHVTNDTPLTGSGLMPITAAAGTQISSFFTVSPPESSMPILMWMSFSRHPNAMSG